MTWFDDEMEVLTSTARQLGMPVAVHTGAAEGCKQAIRFGARSIEHAYLIDSDGLQMADQGLVCRSHNADDSGGFARIASRHAALSSRVEVSTR